MSEAATCACMQSQGDMQSGTVLSLLLEFSVQQKCSGQDHSAVDSEHDMNAVAPQCVLTKHGSVEARAHLHN